MVIILNLALPERTCYEPLASTHPDTQGTAPQRGFFATARTLSGQTAMPTSCTPITLYVPRIP